MALEPLQVDPERLAAAGRHLLSAANQIPSPTAPSAVTGSDPLSQAIAAQSAKVEAPVTEGLPPTKAAAIETAGKVGKAAEVYESTDKRLSDDINKRTFPDAERNGQRGTEAQAVGRHSWKQEPPPTPISPSNMTEAQARTAWAAINTEVREWNTRCGRTFILPTEGAAYNACVAQRGPMLERQAAIRSRLKELGIPIEGEEATPPPPPAAQGPFPPPTEITGMTEHATQQANSRDGGRGVSDSAMQDAVTNPIGPPQYQPDQYGGRYQYVGKDATVVLNKDGQVVTTWANSRNGWRNP